MYYTEIYVIIALQLICIGIGIFLCLVNKELNSELKKWQKMVLRDKLKDDEVAEKPLWRGGEVICKPDDSEEEKTKTVSDVYTEYLVKKLEDKMSKLPETKCITALDDEHCSSACQYLKCVGLRCVCSLDTEENKTAEDILAQVPLSRCNGKYLRTYYCINKYPIYKENNNVK